MASFGGANLTPTICFALLNGFAATLWVLTGTRRMFIAMGIVGCLQAASNIWLVTFFSKGRSIQALQFATFEHYALFNAAVANVLIFAGYSLFLYSFITEGRRHYDTLTEIRLAGAIHRSLVPEIKAAVNPFEFYGCSWPSGEVSGDLVDLVQHDRGWFAYVADVSGHGVPAGVLMTMVKSAARTWLAGVGPSGFLPALNQILLPLSAPNMYVTLAFLSYTRASMELATAGHVPILHFDGLAGTVSERCVSNFPVALIGDVPFEASEIVSGPGDVFVFLTDGMTEVVDDHDRDLGLEPLKSVLIENAGAPLSELASRLRHRALEHGKQTDDQTLLLIRHSRAS
jgi:serine phosphatase RsbU (regulator of sigma subunit)